MGTWNTEAYDNDAAADWFGDTMKATKLRDHWLECIQNDFNTEFNTSRAAVWLFIQLGRVYVWPIDTYKVDLDLAIKVAGDLRNHPELSKVNGMAIKLEAEYQILIGRQANLIAT